MELKERFRFVAAEGCYHKYLSAVHEYCLGQGLNIEDKLDAADKTINIAEKLIEDYKGLPVKQNGNYQKWFEVLAASAYLYYIFYDKEHRFTSLFLPREKTEMLAERAGIPSNEREFIFQGIEAGAGINGPQKLKIQPDTPGEMLVLAIWITENLGRL